MAVSEIGGKFSATFDAPLNNSVEAKDARNNRQGGRRGVAHRSMDVPVANPFQ
jgi:hypothetical protein